MEVLYILIPVAIILALIIAGLFIWAVNNKQFEDLERHGNDIIFDDDNTHLNAKKESPK